MLTMLHAGRRRRRLGERGAVAVEAALVTPFLVMLVLGIIEFTFVLRDYVAVTSATRSGARISSANAGAGPQFCDSGESGTACSNTNAPQLAKLGVNAIATQGVALNRDLVNYVMVYKANASGFPGSLTAWGANPQTDCSSAGNGCVVYQWQKAADKFKYLSGSWTSSTINACASQSDSVGVYVSAQHPFISGLFGATLTVTDRTVMRFEPLTATICAPGSHA
ncbi:MAG: TadE family protein [Nocardioidaceae bacterium]